jgi:predicted phage terminase large subunit-like protein
MNIQESSVVRSLVRGSFFEFVREFWSVIIEEPPVFNWHVRFLCNELQRIAERVFLREEREYDLLCNVPPGLTKSTICSQMFPAWVWTRMPSAQFICVSYAYSIAMKDSLKTRDIVQSDLYQACFPDTALREDANTKGMFVNKRKGFRLAVGVLGAVTGMHGHFLIVDDPLNPEQAYSEAELKTVNRWMRTTLPSRRIPKHVAPIILIQQRLHQMDPSGEMLERYQGKKLRHICLPGEVTKDISPPELVKKYRNGLLDPVRLSRDVLAELLQELGPYGYAGQILQTPVPPEGGMYEVGKFNRMKEAPAFKRVVRSWDKAGTEGAGKYSVGLKLGIDANNQPWVIDIKRGQWGSTKRERNIRATAEEDGIGVEVLIEIEGGSGGKESGESTVKNLSGFRVTTIHPTGDKETRAYPSSTQVGAGNVFVLDRWWTQAFIDELQIFPFGKYSDQVDAFSQAFNHTARPKRKVGGMW